MLLYYNGNFSRQLFQWFGSAVWRGTTLSIGFAVAVVTAGLQYNLDMEAVIKPSLPHQYPMQTLGVIMTIAIVFRTNQAWKRYWEGISQLHFMYSKWADAFSQFCGFVSVTIMAHIESAADVEEKIAKLQDMHEKVQNDFLLLSAMACDRICRGDCAQMERRNEIGFPWTERIVLRENLRECDDDLSNGTGMPRFRSTEINHLKEECSVSRQNDAHIRGFWDAEYPVIKPPTGTKYTLLNNSFDRANMVVNWLNHNLAYCSKDLVVAPPIQSRMYQEISNGMLGFNNVVKVADVPLAFPYSQVILILMTLWNVFIPFYVVSFTRSLIAGPALAFLLSSFMFCLNCIASELENPFGLGANKVCVPEFHSRFLLVITDATRSCYNPPRPPKAARVTSHSRPLWRKATRSLDALYEVAGKIHDSPLSRALTEEYPSGDRESTKSTEDDDGVELAEATDSMNISTRSMDFVDLLQTATRATQRCSAKQPMQDLSDCGQRGAEESQRSSYQRTVRNGSLFSMDFSVQESLEEPQSTASSDRHIPEEPGTQQRQQISASDHQDYFAAISDSMAHGFQQQNIWPSREGLVNAEQLYL